MANFRINYYTEIWDNDWVSYMHACKFVFKLNVALFLLELSVDWALWLLGGLIRAELPVKLLFS